jgi:hypothetical protein
MVKVKLYNIEETAGTFTVTVSVANDEGGDETEEPEQPTVGTEENPIAGAFDEDYVANFPGGYTGIYYTFVAPKNGYVTFTTTYEGKPWIMYGTSLDYLSNNKVGMDPETYEDIYAYTVSVYAFKDQTVYFAVGDFDFVAGDVPFKVTFEEFETESCEPFAGTWTGEIFDDWGGSLAYTVVINADGTGTVTENYGWGEDVYEITFILVDGENVTVFTTGTTFTYKYNSETGVLSDAASGSAFTKA